MEVFVTGKYKDFKEYMEDNYFDDIKNRLGSFIVKNKDSFENDDFYKITWIEQDEIEYTVSGVTFKDLGDDWIEIRTTVDADVHFQGYTRGGADSDYDTKHYNVFFKARIDEGLKDVKVTNVTEYSVADYNKDKSMSQSWLNYLYEDRMDEYAEDFLRRNYPKALLQYMAIDPLEVVDLNEDDHPAIIDHATFEQANAMIKSHGERLGREKAVKDTKRYVFSGRLICGFCGGHMRRGKDARAYYACGNHLHKRAVMVEGTEAPCPMLPVFEQDVKNAFATVLNRLAADPSILAISDDGTERERLEAQLQSVKRRQSVLHDRALADRYTAQLREKKADLDSEEKTILDDLAKLEKKNPVDDLKRAVAKRGVRESFTESDENLFKAFVDYAVLWSKEKAQFHFTCGLVAEEDMHVEKVGRSYTDVPVRTEFDEKGAFTWQ